MSALPLKFSNGANSARVMRNSSGTAVHTLYLCYFGLHEPLVQTQVLPYLRQLVIAGIKVSLLTFEPKMRTKWSPDEIERERIRLADEGISWYCLPYHKRPSLPATLYDVAAGARLAMRLMRKHDVNVLHARTHVPALMAAIAKRLRGGRLVFDIRGFMPEEYTDAGVWPENGYLYRGAKRVERHLLEVSDAFIVLTEKAREILFPGCDNNDSLGRPIEVIPCCVDPARFSAADKLSRDDIRRERKLTDRRVIVYIGSFGGWYLTEEMTEFLAQAHRQDPSTFSLILTQSSRTMVLDRLRSLGVDEDDVLVTQASPLEVPRYLKAADFAISFIKACYSKQSSSPTKVAEYLASGLPIICNSGVGDLDQLIEEDRVGVIVDELTPAGYTKALEEMTELLAAKQLREHCREVAWRRFDLEQVGGHKYTRLYRRLSGNDDAEHADKQETETIPSSTEVSQQLV